MLVNVAPKLVPTVVAAVMIATAMSAAIKPYSIAVAPASFRSRALKIFMMVFLEIVRPDATVAMKR
jgi:hypothetical protein